MNDHGWKKLGGPGTMLLEDGAAVAIHHLAIAPIVEKSRRCACVKVCCHRRATAEDLLCDECRAECR